jgi:transcriptional regulator with XRE-family HTH domain
MHPIKQLLQQEGRKLYWLADQTGYARSYVWSVLNGHFRPSSDFRRACSRVMGRPESELFTNIGPARPYRRQKREVA